MTKDQFLNRFFGPEGNSKEYSFIAFENNIGSGLILGGINCFDGLKTLRCGTMCIVPDKRGSDVAKILFQKHKEVAIENNCKQLFLEVIASNYRAIKFYERHGYDKVYDLNYYSAEIDLLLKKNKETAKNNIAIENISLNDLENFRNDFFQTHINWQNNFSYMKKLDSKALVIKVDDDLAGAIAFTGDSIHFLGVKQQYRNRGLGTTLVLKASLECEYPKIKSSFPNNSSLKGFFEKIGFQKESLSQYEMYLTVE